MADNDVQDESPAADTPPPPTAYSAYQIELYMNGIAQRILPATTTDANKLRLQAKAAMRPEAFDYITGGAGEGATMDANRLAFRQWKIIPRMLRPTVPRDLRVELFGQLHESPVLCAPIGVQAVYHTDRELGTAAACASLRVPFIMSTSSTSTMAEVASACDDAARADEIPVSPRWFQLYWPIDDAITASLLHSAKAAGFTVLVVTLDTATMSWRPADLDRTFLPFATGPGNNVGFADPVFRKKFAEMSGGDTPENDPLSASRAWIAEAFSGDSHAWDHLKILKKHWDGPIVLKGIQHPDDAIRALEYGVDGIIVSNHGGRQVDGAVASLDMLPEIVEAVGDKATVLFDSGIRTGADIFKALCLGAKAVLVGRPVMYGLGIAGKDGARHVLASLLADLDGTMGLAGVKSVKDLNKKVLRRVQYGGDVKSSL